MPWLNQNVHPFPALSKSPADNSRADKVLAMRTQWGCWGWTQFTSSSLFSLALLLTDAVWFSRDTFIFTAAIRSWLWTACALLLGSLPPCSNSYSHPDLHSKLLQSFNLSLFIGLSFGYWSVSRWPNFAHSSVLGVKERRKISPRVSREDFITFSKWKKVGVTLAKGIRS